MRPEVAREARTGGATGEPASLPLKIERAGGSGRTRSRRARLSDLPLESLRVPPDMNANVALLELDPKAAPCAKKLSEINESLRGRERLLMASATASRLLLEAPDVRAAIPGVLGLIGEAAHVDRVSVMETRTGPQGEPLLVVASEWTAPGVTPYLQATTSFSCDERDFSSVCAQLRAGRSVCLSKSETPSGHASSGIEGVGTKTKAIVPIFVASEFIGVVGFDNTRQQRAIDASELAALETAAGVIGVALHRERLVDDARRGGAGRRARQGERRDPRQPRAPRRPDRPAQLHGPHAARGDAPVRCRLRGRDRAEGLATTVAHRRAWARGAARGAAVRRQRAGERLVFHRAVRGAARAYVS